MEHILSGFGSIDFGLGALSRAGAKVRRRVQSGVTTVLMAVMCACMLTTGCTVENSKQVVADVSAQIPIALTFVSTAGVIATSIDPAASLLITSTQATVEGALAELKVMCDAYAQSQSPTALAAINDALNKVLGTNAAALLDALKIVDPLSRTVALTMLGGFQTALQLVYAILQRAQTRSQIAQTAAMRTYKLRDVAPYLDQQKVADATGHSFAKSLRYEEAQGF